MVKRRNGVAAALCAIVIVWFTIAKLPGYWEAVRTEPNKANAGALVVSMLFAFVLGICCVVSVWHSYLDKDPDWKRDARRLLILTLWVMASLPWLWFWFLPRSEGDFRLLASDANSFLLICVAIVARWSITNTTSFPYRLAAAVFAVFAIYEVAAWSLPDGDAYFLLQRSYSSTFSTVAAAAAAAAFYTRSKTLALLFAGYSALQVPSYFAAIPCEAVGDLEPAWDDILYVLSLFKMLIAYQISMYALTERRGPIVVQCLVWAWLTMLTVGFARGAFDV